MGVKNKPLPRIEDVQAAACSAAAIEAAQGIFGDGDGYVSPKIAVGKLTPYEWHQLVNAALAGWTVERMKQLTGERWWHQDSFYATGQTPEPSELGVCAAVLPALGDLIEARGLSDKTIGEWSKQDIMVFVWTAAEHVANARVALAERPGPAIEVIPEDMTMAG